MELRRKLLNRFVCNPAFWVATLLFLSSVFGLHSLTFAAASPNNVVSYQGRILNTNGVPVSDATATVIFRLYDSLGGDVCLWSDSSATCATATGRDIALTDGLFSENLGDTAAAVPYPAIASTVFADNNAVYLSISVNGELLTPRKLLTAAPYALNSQTLDGIDSTGFLSASGDSGTGTYMFTVGNANYATVQADLIAGARATDPAFSIVQANSDVNDFTGTTTSSLFTVRQDDLLSTGTTAYILQQGTGIAFQVDDVSGDTTPFVIDALGNVGIGIASLPSTVKLGIVLGAAEQVVIDAATTDHTSNSPLTLDFDSNGAGGDLGIQVNTASMGMAGGSDSISSIMASAVSNVTDASGSSLYNFLSTYDSGAATAGNVSLFVGIATSGAGAISAPYTGTGYIRGYDAHLELAPATTNTGSSWASLVEVGNSGLAGANYSASITGSEVRISDLVSTNTFALGSVIDNEDVSVGGNIAGDYALWIKGLWDTGIVVGDGIDVITTGLSIVNTTTDITTGNNEALTITPLGTGDTIFSLDADTNTQFISSDSPSVDMVTISTNGHDAWSGGVDGLAVTFGVDSASGDAVHIIPSFGDVISGSQTYNAIEVDNFVPANSSGINDDVNGLKIGTMTEATADITSKAINIGAGWDTAISVAGGNNTFVLNAGNQFSITAPIIPTVDMVVISNNTVPSGTSGVDGLQLTFGSDNASGQAFHIIPSFSGGATDTLTYNVIGVDAFSAVNGAGTDTVNGISVGALTDPGATITSTALNIGTGWDTIINGVGFDVANTTGATTIAGSAEGTAALTLNLGDIVITDGDLTLTSGQFEIPDNTINAFTLEDATGGLDYINVTTTDGSETMVFGHSTVDSFTFTSDNNAAADLAITGGVTVTSAGTHDSFTITSSVDTENAQLITANSLTTGTALIIPHTASVIANGGSLARFSSTSNDTSTTTGVLLDLSSTASLAGTQFLQTYSGLTTGIGQSLVANALTTGDAFLISSTGVGLTSGSLLRVSSATTGVVATDGIVSLVATGAYTSTANVGLLNVVANSTQTGTIQNISGNALTSGVELNMSSTSTAFTGDLLAVTQSGSNAANTGNLVDISNTGVASANTAVYVKHYATGTNNLALRVDDVSGDTTPFVIDGAGNVGIGTSAPISQLHVPGSLPTGTLSTVTTGTPSSPNDLFIQGRYAYLTDFSANALKIFDISNPAIMVQVGSVATGSQPYNGIYVQGRYAYLMTFGSDTLEIYDVSNPFAPAQVATIAAGTNPSDLYVQGRYAYVTNSTSLQIFDVSNPAVPVSLGTVAATTPSAVKVQSRYVYVVGGALLQIFDASNPAAVVSVGSAVVGTQAADIYVQGRYAYIVSTGPDDFEIFDISNPAIPVSVSTIAAGADPFSVWVQGRYAYVSNYNAFTLQIYDVSTPASPVSVGTIPASFNSRGIQVQGRYAYQASVGNDTFDSFDLGGAYIQGFEAGGVETGTLSVRNNLSALDGAFRGSLSASNGLEVQGGLSVDFAGTINPTSAVKITANALTTGTALIIPHTTSVIATGGSLARISSSSIDTNVTQGTLLDLSATATVAGRLMNIASSASSQTTTTALNITQSGTATGYTGNLVNITGSSTTGAGKMLNITTAASSAGTALSIVGSSMTAGSSAIGITPNTGAAINVASTTFQMIMSNAGTFSLTDGTNTLFSIVDSGVSGTTSVGMNGVATANGLCHSGTNLAVASDETRQIVACTGAPTDIAEWYDTTGTEAGDVVTMTSNTASYSAKLFNPYTGEETGAEAMHTVSILDKASQPYQNGLIGVISTSPAQSLGSMLKDRPNENVLALIGRVPTKVSTANGSIVPGDPITASTTAGVGMKATEPGMVIGYALDFWTGPGQGVIEVFVHPSWNAGGVISSNGTLPTFTSDFAFTSLAGATSGTPGQDSHGLAFLGSGWNGSAVEDVGMSLKTKVTDANQYRLSFSNKADTEVAYVTQSGDLVISGKLYPSDRGVAQTSKYMYYDGSVGPGGDMMRTNASGWGTGSYDFAEMFPSIETLVPGEVVVFSKLNEHVERSKVKESTQLAGIVSTKPGFLAGTNDVGTFPIALKGRVPTMVVSENGPIEVGDPLTSSSTPGFAMKATKPGMIIGFALEPMTEVTGNVIAFVSLNWWEPGQDNATIPGTSNTASLFGTDGSVSFSSLSMNGAIYMNGNDILNVRRIAGMADKWSIEEDGTMKTEGEYRTIINNYQNEKVEVRAVNAMDSFITLVGTSTVQGGTATVSFAAFDPHFNGVTSTTAPVRVLLTPNGPIALYVTQKDANGFTVQEIGGNSSGVTFDWMVYAYRKDYEPKSLDPNAPVVVPVVVDPIVSSTPPIDVVVPPADTTVTPPPTDPVIPPADVVAPPPSDTVVPPTDVVVPPADTTVTPPPIVTTPPVDTTVVPPPTDPTTVVWQPVADPVPAPAPIEPTPVPVLEPAPTDPAPIIP